MATTKQMAKIRAIVIDIVRNDPSITDKEIIYAKVQSELKFSDVKMFKIHRDIKEIARLELKHIKEMRDAIILLKRFNAARDVSYDPERSRVYAKRDYDVAKIFGRLIISIVSHYGTVSFTMTGSEPASVKWVEEMESYGLYPRLSSVIEAMNAEYTDTDASELVLENISSSVYDDLTMRYSKYNTDGHAHHAIMLMCYRYTAYNAWSQCWTLMSYDRPDVFKPLLNNVELFGAPFNVRNDTRMFGTLFPDTDAPFGGIGRYTDLAEKIIADNDLGIQYNIQVNPPYLESIMNDLVPIVHKLAQRNNVFVMYPTWTDNKGYQEMSRMFKQQSLITEAVDTMTGQIIPNVESTLFYDLNPDYVV